MGRDFFLAVAPLFVVWCVVVASSATTSSVGATSRQQPAPKSASKVAPDPSARPHYRIELKLDFDARNFEGTQRLRWTNRESRPVSALYFHLYPNLRPAPAGARDAARASSFAAPADADEPHLEVTQARDAATGQRLSFVPEDGGVSLRVQLREPLAAGASAEVELSFKGVVPEIDPDETSLTAHVVQQVGAALRDTRETRRARDTNFLARGVMLLGSFHPVLAVRAGGEWRRRVEAGVGDSIFAEAADYDVTIDAPGDVRLYTSGEDAADIEQDKPGPRHFSGKGLRGFALVAGRALRSAEREVGLLRVRSIYTADHERVGRRALTVAADAARTFQTRFGPLAAKTVSVAEAPLVAGLGSTEFTGLSVIASAFYVDFDSPATRNLPEVVREQRASVEESLEFAVAQGVAHLWWGAAVGNDPEREPVLDEGLAHWSALLYVQDVHGESRAASVMEDQLRGVYQIYRTFGGEDRAASAPSREYRNSFQYAAIVVGKGALMFAALRRQLGDERFFRALRAYYEANKFETAEMDDLRAAFAAEAALAERRALTRLFTRWLSEKHGDEDIAPPNPQLAAALGLSTEPAGANRNPVSRLGRFFWRQMTRIR